MLRGSRAAGWADEGVTGIAVLALAAAAYAAALVASGNGFVAAFCAGLAFGAAAGRRGPAEVGFTEQAGELVGLLVWLAFGAVAVPSWSTAGAGPRCCTPSSASPWSAWCRSPWPAWGRMDRGTVLFVGWFGPRGLASLVFALLALEDLGTGADDAVAVIAATVLLSVVVHGVSAAPLAARYGRSAGAGREPSSSGDEVPGPARR